MHIDRASGRAAGLPCRVRVQADRILTFSLVTGVSNCRLIAGRTAVLGWVGQCLAAASLLGDSGKSRARKWLRLKRVTDCVIFRYAQMPGVAGTARVVL